MSPLLVVISATDPVAVPTAERWGTPPATGEHLDGAPIRELAPGVRLVRRPGPHIHDEDLDRRLPPAIRAERPTLVFPSIHRSEQNVSSLTVHPLGNPGPTADVGGAPGRLVPTDPLRMAAALRALSEGAGALGVPVTFEATHHGPALELPAFFLEIGYGAEAGPPDPAVALLARVLPELTPSVGDRVALALGGGHYAPHFTELVLSRRWAVGHILSKHALEVADRGVVAAAWTGTPGAGGILYSRAADAERPNVAGIAGRLRDGDAPRRTGPPTPGGRSTAGT